MAIDQTRLRRHVGDYKETTGRPTELFVCPITLRECEENELIDAHVLNKTLRVASRKTVIQYGPVDSFYGTRVEPDMVHFLNMLESDGTRLTKHDCPTRVVFEDGSAVAAFPVGATAARIPDPRFTCLHVPKDNGRLSVFAVASRDDRRWKGKWQLEIQRRFIPPHWTAAMLKAGYLCLFDMIGYRSVFSPFGDALRRTLAAYYDDSGTREDASSYFREFPNAVKILTIRNNDPDAEVRWKSWRFDTLSDREVFLHHSPSGTMFAATCLFNINRVTTSVTMPESIDGADAAVVWDLYSRYMERPVGFPQRIHRARLVEGCWQVEEKLTDVRLVNALPE